MKISDKLKNVTREITISKCDNGFIFEVRGETPEENWASSRIVCNNIEQVVILLNEYSNMTTND